MPTISDSVLSEYLLKSTKPDTRGLVIKRMQASLCRDDGVLHRFIHNNLAGKREQLEGFTNVSFMQLYHGTSLW
jgi:hypothetical protein